MKYLIRFEDDEALHPCIVGHKFVSLAQAYRAGFKVPFAVAISTAAHRFYVSCQRWPEDLFEEIVKLLAELDLKNGISVRSSGTQEDLEKQSFAGQYRSFLNVTDVAVLKDKIERCWESAETDIVQGYLRAGREHDRLESDYDKNVPETPLMGVVLQKMIHAMAAGIAFGCNPMHPRRDEVVVEGIRGLAVNLMSGSVTPHRAFVQSDGTTRVQVPLGDGSGPEAEPEAFLTEGQWQAIARLVRDLEAVTDVRPLDIEWAFDHQGMLWLLQSRSITTIQKEDFKAPAGMWTRRIADDLWADRLTPFLADAMVRNAPRFDLSRISTILGIPVVQPSLTVMNGYLYVNCESIKPAVALMPARLRTREVRALFPREFGIAAIPAPPALKLLAFGVRIVGLLFREPGANPGVCLRRSRRNIKRLEKRLKEVEHLPDASPTQVFDKVRRALATLADIQEKNQWPYLFATLFTWTLRWLVVDIAGRSHTDFLRSLTGNGRNVSIEAEGEFRKMAAMIREDPPLSERLRKESTDRLVKNLPEPFRHTFHAFLAKYGCRARHRTLLVKRWAEAPQEVLDIVKSLAGDAAGSGSSPLSGRAEQDTVHRNRIFSGLSTDDAAAVGGALRWILPPVTRLIWRLAGGFLDLREDLRFLLDKALYQIRQALLQLGANTGLGETVLFLVEKELEALVRGNLSLETAKAIGSQRHDAFAGPSAAGTFLVDGRPEIDFAAQEHILEGIGTSPGRCTGRARIVEDPSRVSIRKGDILIAKNTDPGWTPILSLISGMIMEEGGLLNHCSIVARELGIPAVVGIREATRKIPEGSLITVNGGRGLVQMEKKD